MSPKDWKIVYERIKEARKSLLAPVDYLGCDRLAEASASPTVSKIYK